MNNIANTLLDNFISLSKITYNLSYPIYKGVKSQFKGGSISCRKKFSNKNKSTIKHKHKIKHKNKSTIKHKTCKKHKI